MTYTFKLARRLAVSRKFGMLSAILLFTACSGDATAPDGSTASPWGEPNFRRTVTEDVRITPSIVTVETNQLIHFVARGTTLAGDTVPVTPRWSVSGGTILPDGRFSSAATGSFMVLARSQDRQLERIDTAFVQVVRRQPHLASLAISPETTTLSPGISQTFLVTGYLKDGRAVPVGARWSATGGSIDAGGNYIAGDTAGTYRVIATNAQLTIADTAQITIGAPPPPPPPPAPPAPTPPPPAPVLEKVMLVPASATLAPSTNRQFSAYGLTTNGDSVATEVVFTSTGGTVTQEGLFSAGGTAGTYRVIATAGSLADTSAITVTNPLGSGPASGIPFGPFGLWNSYTGLDWAPDPFTTSQNYTDPAGIVARIATARRLNQKLVLAMTGGEHLNYITNGKFDLAKWTARMDQYKTIEIKNAVAAGVADGTIIGNSVMDEPEFRSWGGAMTKPLLDDMARYVKGIFPTLPVGVNHGPDGYYLWRPEERYRVIDYVVNQYNWWITSGDIAAWRDKVLAQARLDGVTPAFSLNIINGGVQDRDGTWDCIGTGGLGLRTPNCRMSANQLRNWGTTLGTAGCMLLMWKYDAAYMSNPLNAQAFKDVAARLASVPGRSCKRV
jgi:hypothetical protein